MRSIALLCYILKLSGQGYYSTSTWRIVWDQKEKVRLYRHTMIWRHSGILIPPRARFHYKVYLLFLKHQFILHSYFPTVHFFLLWIQNFILLFVFVGESSDLTVISSDFENPAINSGSSSSKSNKEGNLEKKSVDAQEEPRQPSASAENGLEQAESSNSSTSSNSYRCCIQLFQLLNSKNACWKGE